MLHFEFQGRGKNSVHHKNALHAGAKACLLCCRVLLPACHHHHCAELPALAWAGHGQGSRLVRAGRKRRGKSSVHHKNALHAGVDACLLCCRDLSQHATTITVLKAVAATYATASCCILNSREGDSLACITRMLSMQVQRLACIAAESSFQHATTITALKGLL